MNYILLYISPINRRKTNNLIRLSFNYRLKCLVHLIQIDHEEKRTECAGNKDNKEHVTL